MTDLFQKFSFITAIFIFAVSARHESAFAASAILPDWSAVYKSDDEAASWFESKDEFGWAFFFGVQSFEKKIKTLASISGVALAKSHDLVQLCVQGKKFVPDIKSFQCEDFSESSSLYLLVRSPNTLSPSHFKGALSIVKKASAIIDVTLKGKSTLIHEEPDPETELSKNQSTYRIGFKDTDVANFSARLFLDPTISHDRFYRFAKHNFLLAASMPRSLIGPALYLQHSSIETLMKGRLVALNFEVPEGHSAYKLCLSLRWEKLPCDALRPYARFDSGIRYPSTKRVEWIQDAEKIKKTFDDFFTKATQSFADAHKIQILRQSLLETCNPITISSDVPTFIKDLNLDQPHRFEGRNILTQASLIMHLAYGNIFDKSQKIEVWMAPDFLAKKCLSSIGYNFIKKIGNEGYLDLYEAEHKGRKAMLVLGAPEISWIYKVQLSYRVAEKLAKKKGGGIEVYSIAKDPDRFYKDLAELWYFYSVGAFVDTPHTFNVGYGRKAGTGKRFLSAAFGKKKICRESLTDLLHGTDIKIKSKRSQVLHVAFSNMWGVDGLTIPPYYVGHILGKMGVSILGHQSTGGSLIERAKIGDLVVPEWISGFDTKFPIDTLNLAKPIPIDLKIPLNFRADGDQHTYQFGTLGSILNVNLELKSIEEKAQDVWKWALIDTDAFPLFQGFKQANAAGKIFGQYIVTDLSLRQLNGQTQLLGNENVKREWLDNSQRLTAALLEVEGPACD